MRQQLGALYATLSRPTRRRVKLAVVGMIIAGALDSLGVVLMLPLLQMLTGTDTTKGTLGTISRLFGSPSDSTLTIILASAVFLAFMLKGAFSLMLRWWILGFMNRETADASVNLLRRYLNAPYTFYISRNSAELLRTLNDAVSAAYLSVGNAILDVATESLTSLVILIALLVVRPLPAIGVVLYFGMIGVFVRRYLKRRAKVAGDELMEAARDNVQTALQSLGSFKEARIRGAGPYFLKRYHATQYRQAAAKRTSLYLAVAPRYALEMLFILGVAAMSAIIFSTGSSEAGAATLGLFVTAGFRMLPGLSRMVAALAALRVGAPGIELVLADFNLLADGPASENRVAPAVLREKIEAQDLRFAYPNVDHDVIDGISFDIPVGQSLAIVGSSGAGKTTLVDLILGLHEPTGGSIRIDGADLATIRESWQRAIGLVPQDVYLLDDSLRANIAFSEEVDAIDEVRLAEAVERAQLTELVDELPEGLETFVGERGVRISGGQRQRIGIARALYLRPQLLVLDEATSSLDNETENRITDTIESLRGQITMIVVAHRLSTVKRCNQLLFMSNGRIEDRGTFDEVRAANAEFARLVELGSLDPTTDPQ